MNLQFLNNLHFKLAAVFLLVSLLPLGIVSSFSVQTADSVIQTIVGNQLENVAAEKQQLLQRWIGERKADVEVVAGSAAIESLDPAQIAPYLDLVQSQYQVYKRFLIVDGEGRIVYPKVAESDRHSNKEVAGEKVAGEKVAGDNPSGEELCCRRALLGKPYMSEVALDPLARESVFHVATPIRGPDGRVRGAVCATVITAAIVQQVLAVSLGETGECYLVDNAGTFLVHKDPRRVLRSNIAGSGSFQQIFSKNRPKPVYTDYRRIAVLGASRPVAGTQWYVVVEQDRDEAFARSQSLKRSIYIVIVLTVSGVIGLSAMLAFYLTGPIRALGAAADKISRGDFDLALADTRIARCDEIGALYEAFARMAGQLRQRQAQLESRVDLSETQLQRTGEKLQDAMRAVARSEHLAILGRLASGVAHEIRTPLTSLKLYLQSVADDVTVSPELAEDFDIAMKQVTRMEATINQFLDFARPQSSVFTEIDFPKVIADTLLVVQPRAVHQDVEIAVSLSPQLPRVTGDFRQLGEAVVNLLVNALEELPQGGRLGVAVQPEASRCDGRTWVRIDVSDNGPGIQQENVEQLFEPFFTTKASGSGLGLAIVRGTLQRHGGIIRVSNRPEGGTTFSLFLPGLS